jgi:hypothetical protein
MDRASEGLEGALVSSQPGEVSDPPTSLTATAKEIESGPAGNGELPFRNTAGSSLTAGGRNLNPEESVIEDPFWLLDSGSTAADSL